MRKLSDLPATGFMELSGPSFISRGSPECTVCDATVDPRFHLAGTLVSGPMNVRAAVIVAKNGSAIGREEVIEARGSMHHYDQASVAWLVTTGQVRSGAREEANVAGQTPVVLIDGARLGEALEQAGIGFRSHQLVITSLDADLFAGLGSGQTAKDRLPGRRAQPGDDESDDEARPRGEDVVDGIDEISRPERGWRR